MKIASQNSPFFTERSLKNLKKEVFCRASNPRKQNFSLVYRKAVKRTKSSRLFFLSAAIILHSNSVSSWKNKKSSTFF